MKESESTFNPKFVPQEITSENSSVLVNLRSEIDRIDREKLEEEVGNFASSPKKKAFVLFEDENPIGYVEVKSGEQSQKLKSTLFSTTKKRPAENLRNTRKM
jgi:hypothetical protein